MLMGRILSLTVLMAASLVLTACAARPEAPGLSEYGRYHCGQLEIRLTPAENGHLLGLEYLDRRILMKPSPAQAGALYVAPGDASTQFLARGDRATFTLKGEVLPECLEPGAVAFPFDAIGAEPEWSAVLDGKRLSLTPPYQQETIDELWLTQTQANRHGRVWEVKGGNHQVAVRVASQLCETGLEQRQYPAQIRLTLDGNDFQGCGGDRQRLFRGVHWVVEDLAGTGLIDRSLVTLKFMDNGRVAGRASCNHFMGSYALQPDGLSFSALAGTRMACAPALMNQERRYLELLEAVVDGRIGRHGELELVTGSGEVIRAFPASTDNL